MQVQLKNIERLMPYEAKRLQNNFLPHMPYEYMNISYVPCHTYGTDMYVRAAIKKFAVSLIAVDAIPIHKQSRPLGPKSAPGMQPISNPINALI